MTNDRTRALLLIFIAIFSVIFLKLAFLQIVRHKEFEERSLDQHQRPVVLAPDRGDIFDRNGNILATSVDKWSVFVRPRAIANKEEIILALSSIFPGEKALILKKFRDKKNFWLKRKTDKELACRVRLLKSTGIDVQTEKKRVYPKGRLASQLIGYADIDNNGLSGIELGLDESLKGKEGKYVYQYDNRGRQIATAGFRQLESPEEGMNVYLTIDEAIQHVAETSLREEAKKCGAESASVTVMDVKTGEILAIAGYPDYDPNNYSKTADKFHKLSPVTDIYEPGSTFKMITACVGLEEHVVDLDSVIPTPDEFKVEGIKISNSHPVRYYGKNSKSLRDVIAESINTGTAHIGLKLGFERFHKYIVKFGFGARTGIDYPGEVRGIVRDPSHRERGDTATYTFGQSIAVTPIQLVCAIAAIANDGVRVRPRLIKKIESPDKNIIRSDGPLEVERAISIETVKKAKELMKGVVYMPHGTGHKAKMLQYSAAAKSGTAQISVPGRGYLKDRFNASFVGFVPAEKPRIAILVIMSKPRTSIWGATVAAPVFKRTGEFALRYLNAAPDL